MHYFIVADEADRPKKCTRPRWRRCLAAVTRVYGVFIAVYRRQLPGAFQEKLRWGLQSQDHRKNIATTVPPFTQEHCSYKGRGWLFLPPYPSGLWTTDLPDQPQTRAQKEGKPPARLGNDYFEKERECMGERASNQESLTDPDLSAIRQRNEMMV